MYCAGMTHSPTGSTSGYLGVIPAQSGEPETETVVHYESEHESNWYSLMMKKLLRFIYAHRAPLQPAGVRFFASTVCPFRGGG